MGCPHPRATGRPPTHDDSQELFPSLELGPHSRRLSLAMAGATEQACGLGLPQVGVQQADWPTTSPTPLGKELFLVFENLLATDLRDEVAENQGIRAPSCTWLQAWPVSIRWTACKYPSSNENNKLQFPTESHFPAAREFVCTLGGPNCNHTVSSCKAMMAKVAPLVGLEASL